MKNRNIGILLSYINSFASLISGIVMSVVLLRILGDSEYGLYQTVASFANCLVIFEFGTGTVMTRNLSLCISQGDKDGIHKTVSTIWGITLCLTICIAVFSVLFCTQIDNIYSKSLSIAQIMYGKKIFVVVTVYLIISFWVQTINGAILAYEKYTLASVLNILKTLSRTLIVLLLVLKINKPIIIPLVDLLISIILLLFLFWYCKKKCCLSFSLRNFDKQIVKEVAPLCCAIFLQAIVNQANNNVDKFLLGIKTSPEIVSLYSVALFIFNTYSSLTTIPISMYSPQIIQAVGYGKSKEEITNIMIEPSRMITVVSGTILFGFVVAGRQFIEIFYGMKYMDAWIIAIILMVPMYFNMANGIIINVLNAENRRIYRSVILTITTLANIVLTFVWIDIWGSFGAAIATSITTIVGQLIVMNIYYSRVLKIRIINFYRRALRGILCYQIISAIIAFCIADLIQSSIVSLIIGGVIYLLLFIIFFFFKGSTESERIQLRNLFGGYSDK